MTTFGFVFAHLGGPSHGLADGLLHPLLGPDHLLAMVAVGIVASVTAARTERPIARMGAWAAPLAFLAGMTAGGALGLGGWAFPAVELAIVVSVVALGVAVAGAMGDAAIWMPLLALAGLAHGNAHGAEAPVAANPALYVAGFLAATVALHLGGVAIGSALRRRPLLRVTVGMGVAGAGMLLLV
ncbi:MAG TPA: HupE/UreJ family protein [Acidimicrobiia bacterium]|nr:HupE/UreJ family protein [Acidimicrobiia bacterium]